MMVLSSEVRQARAAALATALEGGTLTFYTAPQPASGAAVTTQTALAAYPLPASITPVEAVLSLSLAPATIASNGTAVWGRMVDSGGAWVIDGDCGDLASSALFKLRTTELIQDGTLIPLTVQISEG